MRLSLTLAVLACSNILLTLLAQWFVITHLGVGIQTDAFFAAMTVPQLILSVVSSSLTHVLVPLLATENEQAFQQNAWGFFAGVTALFSLLAVVLLISSRFWVPLMFPGFSSTGLELTITLTRIQLITMVLTASVAVLWSVYHARQRFVWAELSPVLANLVALVLIVMLLPVYGVVAAVWIIALRTLLQMVLLVPGLGRPVWVNRRSATFTEAWKRIRPLLMGTTYYRMDPIVDRYLSSLAPAGGLSLLYIAQQLYGVANVVIEKAVTAPMVPQLAQFARQEDWLSFRSGFRRRLLYVTAITLAGFLLFVAVGEPVLALLIGRGGITADNIHSLWLIMIALVGFLIGGSAGQVTATTFYAMGDTRTPTRMSVVTFSIYVPAKIIAFIYYGLTGLAVVTSAYLFLNLALQILLLERFSLRGRVGARRSESVAFSR
jgi:putative peptidoglycan lipid II flippase